MNKIILVAIATLGMFSCNSNTPNSIPDEKKYFIAKWLETWSDSVRFLNDSTYNIWTFTSDQANCQAYNGIYPNGIIQTISSVNYLSWTVNGDVLDLRAKDHYTEIIAIKYNDSTFRDEYWGNPNNTDFRKIH